MKIETPILRRLGPVPFWRGSTKCLDELQRIYRRAALLAEDTLRTANADACKISREDSCTSPASRDRQSCRRPRAKLP